MGRVPEMRACLWGVMSVEAVSGERNELMHRYQEMSVSILPFYCFLLVPTVDSAQVLPDWRGPRTEGGGALHDEVLEALRERTEKACIPSLVSEAAKNRTRYRPLNRSTLPTSMPSSRLRTV